MAGKGDSRIRAIDERLSRRSVVSVGVDPAPPTLDALWRLAKADGSSAAATFEEFVEEGNAASAVTSEWAKRHHFTSVHRVGSMDYIIDLLAAREGFDRSEAASEMARVLCEARALDDPTIVTQSRFRQ